MHFVQPPKYRADTISITVPFIDMLATGDSITGTPTVTVSVFTGIDPTPAGILYSNVMVHNGDTLEQIVWQGVVGVIYQLVFSISTVNGDTYEKDCYLGILPQEGSAVSPTITFYYTSRPYPVEYAEGITNSINPNYLHLLLNPSWTEGIKNSIASQYGTLALGAFYYNNYPPEGIKNSIIPSSGQLIKNTVISYSYDIDGIKNSIAAISGTLIKGQVFYVNYQPEGLQNSIAPQGGTLA